MVNDFLARGDAAKAAKEAATRAAANGHAEREHPSVAYMMGNPTEDARALIYANGALNKACREMAATPEGERNAKLNKHVFKLARFVADGLLTEDQITEEFRAAATAAGLDADEITNTIASGLKGRRKKPVAVTIPPPRDNVTVTEVAPTQPATIPPDDIFSAEQDYWERPSLKTIFDAALMRMTPPWGVMAHCAARALHQVRPVVKLPPLVGGPASLNWFAAVTSISGDGKSNSAAVAEDLVPGVDDSAIRNMGSGEGLIAQYRPPGKNPDDREALLFFCDEVATMTAMKNRQGSTTMSVLRDAFMGSPPGHSYVKNSGPNPRHLSKHEYRMTLVLSVQPGMAGDLLADYLSGTLQRFQWFPGFDRRCVRAKAAPEEFVPSLALPRITEWSYPRTLDVPPEAVEIILAEAEKRSQGLVGAADGHAMLVREKFAFALAVLDDRTEMNMDDWRLAGIAAEISQRTRQWVAEKLVAAEDEMLGREGARMGVRALAADEEKARRTWARTYNRISKLVLIKLIKAESMTTRGLTISITSRDRIYLPNVLIQMHREGLIDKHDKYIYAV